MNENGRNGSGWGRGGFKERRNKIERNWMRRIKSKGENAVR